MTPAAFHETVEPVRQSWAATARGLLTEIAAVPDEDDMRELALWDRLLTVWAMLDSGQRADLKRHATQVLEHPDVQNRSRKLDGALWNLED